MMTDLSDTQKVDPTGGDGKKPQASHRRMWIIVAAIVATLAVIVAIICGVVAHNKAVAAEQARVKAAATARVACDKSIDRVEKAQEEFSKTVNSKTVVGLLKLKDSQVSDAKTLKTLKSSVKDSSTVAPCKANTVTALKKSTAVNDKTAQSVSSQEERVTSAASAVEKSHKSKVEADRKKAEEKRKAEEARRKAEQARQAQQAAQSQAQQSSP